MLMHSSIVSRFRGALLGAALGESLGAHCHAQPVPGRSWATIEDWAFQPLPVDDSRAMPTVVQRLLNSSLEIRAANALEGNDPADLVSQLPAVLLGFDQAQPISEGNEPLFSLNPLLLDEHLLRQAIALILRGCPPHQLIAQLVALWQVLSQDDAHQVINYLGQVQALVESGQGLTLTSSLSVNMIQSKIRVPALDSIASRLMPVALYGFLCAPEDGRVALLRTAQLNHHPQITCALTGALVGAWGGVRAMPITWRRCFHSSQKSSALSSLWQVASESSLFHLADQLAAAWAGVYHPGDRFSYAGGLTMASLPPDGLVTTNPV